ncbi:ATP-binding protein, partial [Tumebacillus permanentifrigoris]|uniref:ATP-binding protein n=1 Tax=Tumebacillus permanentifrigoris TaxID=378543 RepID=UPI003CCC871F
MGTDSRNPPCSCGITYLEFLDKRLQEELTAKHDRYLRTRTRLAKLPYHKTIDQF